jgi:hypothetical protein
MTCLFIVISFRFGFHLLLIVMYSRLTLEIWVGFISAHHRFNVAPYFPVKNFFYGLCMFLSNLIFLLAMKSIF